MPTHYLDHAATTPVRPEAAEAWRAAPGGNASSLHTSGRRARRVLEEARESIAAHMRCDASDVIFTSGGTMANNVAVRGIHSARAGTDGRRDTVVVSAVEHHAVLDAAAAASAARVIRLPVDHEGRVRLAELGELLRSDADRISVVSVMSANNEVGTVQPIAALAALCHTAGIPLHVDAVQSAGWGPLPASHPMAVSVSGHKFGAPVGVGALVLPPEIPCDPLIVGGGQERKIHSGTLNVAGASAMAAALTAARGSHLASAEPGVRIDQLRDELAARVLEAVPGARRAGPTADATDADADADERVGADSGEHPLLPGIVSVLFDGCESDALLMLLDARGVECSTGSACTAGIPQPSHVLEAMGFTPEAARSALRFSLGWTSTRADVDALVDALPAAVERARRASARSGSRMGGIRSQHPPERAPAVAS